MRGMLGPRRFERGAPPASGDAPRGPQAPFGESRLSTTLWIDDTGSGAEHCSLLRHPGGYRVRSSALRAVDGKPMEIRYSVSTDLGWRVVNVELVAYAPSGRLELDLRSDSLGHWTEHGAPVSSLDTCVDADLAFTPSTKSLAIRRLDLAIGEIGLTQAVFVQFPRLELTPIEASYERTGDATYRYTSADHTTTIEIDEWGMVKSYAGGWSAAARA